MNTYDYNFIHVNGKLLSYNSVNLSNRKIINITENKQLTPVELFENVIVMDSSQQDVSVTLPTFTQVNDWINSTSINKLTKNKHIIIDFFVATIYIPPSTANRYTFNGKELETQSSYKITLIINKSTNTIESWI